MPSPELFLRPYRDADAAEIAALYEPYVRETTISFEVEPPDAAEMGRRLSALAVEGFPVLVAEHEGRVLGYAYAARFRTRAAYRETVEHSVYVDRTAQRSGIGRRLMNALIEQCTAQGFREMIAVIGDSESTASIAFHSALGFRNAGYLEGVGTKFGRRLGTTYLQKSLRPD